MQGLGALLVVLLLLPLLATAGDRVPLPRVNVDKATTCVLPAAQMRREHPNLLKHRRDVTVHQGVRGGSNALTACIDCHAGKTGTVIGQPEAFCESCHAYAAVKLDCFECHQGRRDGRLARGN